MEKQWTNALSGLWKRRKNPAARDIIENALAEAEAVVGDRNKTLEGLSADCAVCASPSRKILCLLLHDWRGGTALLYCVRAGAAWLSYPCRYCADAIVAPLCLAGGLSLSE